MRKGEGKRRAKLVEGKVSVGLLKLIGPMIFGMLSVILFNVVDTYFVSQLGTSQLAAIGFTFPVVFFIGSLTMGLGTGAMSVVARALGAGDQGRVKRLTTDSLILSMVVVAVVGGVGYPLMEPLFKLLGAQPRVLSMVMDYMSIWFFGLVFLVVPMVGNSVIRSTGDALTPALIMLIAGAVNAALDPLFIFGIGPFPAMGIEGAAVATVLSRGISLTVAFLILWRREKLILFERVSLNEMAKNWLPVLRIGLPAAGMNVVVPLATAVLTALCAGYGEAAVAGFAAGGRIEALASIVPIAMASAMGPFVGQNWGAKRYDRVAESLRLSLWMSLLWGVAAALVLALAAKPIAAIFTDDPQALEYLILYLWVVPIGIGFMSVFMSSAGALNAVNRPFLASGLGLLRALVLTVPLAALGSWLWGVMGILVGMTVANSLVGLAAWLATLDLRRGREPRS